MKNTEFQKFLFRSAVSAMAIDGEIHQSEMDSLKEIVRNSAYFFDFEYDKELEENISYIRKFGIDAVNQYLNLLEDSVLTGKQEVILIEVLLRIIEADQKFETDEIKFLQMVKAKIKTQEEILIMKFPMHADHLLDFNKYGSIQRFDHEISIT